MEKKRFFRYLGSTLLLFIFAFLVACNQFTQSSISAVESSVQANKAGIELSWEAPLSWVDDLVTPFSWRMGNSDSSLRGYQLRYRLQGASPASALSRFLAPSEINCKDPVMGSTVVICSTWVTGLEVGEAYIFELAAESTQSILSDYSVEASGIAHLQ